MKKTKIVATIGPASYKSETLLEMIKAGMNVCRLNFSHGKHEDHLKVINNINALNEKYGFHVALLADLGGPKMRIGDIENNQVVIKDGEELIITTDQIVGNSKKVSIQYTKFAEDVKAGEKIMIDDGKLILEVVSTNNEDEVKAKVLHGGKLSSKKGVNLPNTNISLPSLTENDREDLKFALENNVNWVALSFVRSASDIIELKHIIRDSGSDARVIAKVEKPEAVDDLEHIIRESDGVMVARGDLGVELPMQDVPLIQKEIVTECMKQAKPVIIATQMMESMIENITPTRAEVNDVANAVLDGADAVMLSAETSVGKFPVKVIEAMSKIVNKIETSDKIYHMEHELNLGNEERLITDSICDNACNLARNVDAKAIVTMTFSGYTAFKISSYRPKAWIYVFTSNHKILNMLSLIWGVKGVYYDKFVSTDHTIADIKYILRKNGEVEENDLVVNVASMPINEKGKSNMLKLSYVN
ncbi:MAG: pyruvate kinase [Flavobacteriales bacterium]|nr:pyruvate kinase [Flavobacteriales bacterium]